MSAWTLANSLLMRYSSIEDIIVAPATIPGTGAIGIIRVSGAGCLEVIDKVVNFKSGNTNDFKGYSIHFGTIFSDNGFPIDEVLVSIFRAPHSYTGEDSTEISYHASSYIASEILRLLCANGARLAQPGEYTQRAFVSGKMDLAQAEAVADLISSSSAAAHRVAFTQLRGGVSEKLASMRSELIRLLSLMELELDFSEEDVEFADRTQLTELIDRLICHISSLASTFHLGNAIKNGIPVAIVGRANAGKSTLLNALLGENRAIVSAIPGTTRDTIEEIFNIEGLPYRLIDTAGLRESTDEIEKIGIERTMSKLSKADIVIGVVDLSENSCGQCPLSDNAIEAANEILSFCDLSKQAVVLALNKTDLIGSPEALNKNVTAINEFVSKSVNAEFSDKVRIVTLSASSLEGLDQIKSAIQSLSPAYSSNSDSVLISNARHHAALLQALEHLHAASDGLAAGLPTDLLAQELHDATDSLSSITGLTIDPDAVLGAIFAGFCVGK